MLRSSSFLLFVACASVPEGSLPKAERVVVGEVVPDSPRALPFQVLPNETDFAGIEGPIGPEAKSADGRRRVLSRWVDGALSSELVALEASGETMVEHVLVAEGNPDRAALSEDGRHVAYCSAESGWASVYVMAFEGGEPTQLTNVALAPEKVEGMPKGWVPPPVDYSLRFEGDFVVWNGPDDEHRAQWR